MNVWAVIGIAFVIAIIVSLYANRQTVQSVSTIIKESSETVTNKLEEMGGVTTDLDRRLRRLEGMVLKDLVTGGTLYEAMVSSAGDELADIIPPTAGDDMEVEDEEENNAAERTAGSPEAPESTD